MAFAGQGSRVRLDVELLAVRDAAKWRRASGRANLLVEGTLPDVEAGDRLQVFAQLTAPSPVRNPGDLDQAENLRGQRVLGQLRAKFSESVEAPPARFLLEPRAMAGAGSHGGQ